MELTKKTFGTVDVNRNILKPINNNEKNNNKREDNDKIKDNNKPTLTLEDRRKKLPPFEQQIIKKETIGIEKRRKNNSKIVVYKDYTIPKEKIIKVLPKQKPIFNLFLEEDTPIYKLPVDCLIIIFNHCKDTNTLNILSNVCKYWKKVIQQPLMWREINCSPNDLNKKRKEYEHIRKLIIESKVNINLITTTTIISPFKRLEILQLNSIKLNDIELITLWIKDIKILNCKDIPVNNSNFIPNLSGLKELNTLKLQFSKKCSLKLPYFLSEPNLYNLPNNLEILEINNLFDKEEYIITSQDIYHVTNYILREEESINLWKRELLPLQILDTWLKLESELVLKYKMLSYLSNLKKLSLDKINSFTARIWIECLLPCCENLTFISFNGWHGDRESPQSIIQRKIHQNDIIDIDQALTKYISSLLNIETIVLNDFMCTLGLIEGLKKLNKQYIIEDDQQLKLGKILFNFKISIINL